jgi:hypothetical protein
MISRDEIRMFQLRRDLDEASRVEGLVSGNLAVLANGRVRTYTLPKGGWPPEILNCRPRKTRAIRLSETRNDDGLIIASSVVPTVFHTWSQNMNLDLDWISRNPAYLLDNAGLPNDLKRLIMALGRDKSEKFDADFIADLVRLAMSVDLDEKPVNWPKDAEPVTRRDILVTAVLDGFRHMPLWFPDRGRITLPLLEDPKIALSPWAYAGPKGLDPQDFKAWIVPFTAVLADLYNGYWTPDVRAPRLTADQARATLQEFLDFVLPIPDVVQEILRFMTDPEPDRNEECRKMALIFESLYETDFPTWLRQEVVRRALFSPESPDQEPLL